MLGVIMIVEGYNFYKLTSIDRYRSSVGYI